MCFIKKGPKIPDKFKPETKYPSSEYIKEYFDKPKPDKKSKNNK